MSPSYCFPCSSHYKTSFRKNVDITLSKITFQDIKQRIIIIINTFYLNAMPFKFVVFKLLSLLFYCYLFLHNSALYSYKDQFFSLKNGQCAFYIWHIFIYDLFHSCYAKCLREIHTLKILLLLRYSILQSRECLIKAQ